MRCSTMLSSLTTFVHRFLYITKISPVIRTGEREGAMVGQHVLT